jgi:fructose-1,6-bisphosphatase/sedoheptulose 1,7-bisphosphatase-like protein
MGTVSGSLGLVFLAFERVTTGAATGSLVAGVEDTNTGASAGAGAELLPAGWLAAAAIRAANSLESRFFFMLGPFL